MNQKTNFSTSTYRGGRRAASISSGGKTGRNGKFINRRQRYYDMRLAMGRSGG